MTENRDPLVCPNCDTVNPWLNKVCRACGEPLSRQEKPEEQSFAISESTPGEEPDAVRSEDAKHTPSSIPPIFEGNEAGSKKKWNVLWMLVGVFLYGAAMVVGEFVIVKWIVAPDPELSSMLEEIQTTAQTTTELGDKERDKYRQLLAGKSSFMLALALLALLPPLLAGAVVGYFSDRVLEGAASMGLAVVVYFLTSGQAVLALVTGPINAGLGAAGSYFGGLLRQRIAARRR